MLGHKDIAERVESTNQYLVIFLRIGGGSFKEVDENTRRLTVHQQTRIVRVLAKNIGDETGYFLHSPPTSHSRFLSHAPHIHIKLYSTTHQVSNNSILATSLPSSRIKYFQSQITRMYFQTRIQRLITFQSRVDTCSWVFFEISDSTRTAHRTWCSNCR